MQPSPEASGATTTSSTSTSSSTSSSSASDIPYPHPWFYRESSEAGYVYRQHRPPKPATSPRTVQPLPELSALWKPLELTLPQQPVPPPEELPIARLAHGLKRVVFNEGVHPLRDFQTHKPLFSPFLRKIHQPAEINYDSMPPFVTTSKDKILHKLAGEQGVKYKGSTSSMSPTLSQIYRLLSNFKPPDFDCFSPQFKNMAKGFTKSSIKPVCLFLRPVDGIYSIDSDPGNIPVATNQILLDLGKSLERMLTTEPEEFNQEFLLSGKPTGKYSGPEAYHYLKMGDFLLRSQLDCYEPDLPGEHKTFDLKTRATMGVRVNMGQYEKHLKYRLTCVRGNMFSYEREFYDICRAAMLKYWYQVRIGKMHGIFVCYHNTREVFGFEYMKQEEMERILFGNSEFADVAFQAPMRLWQNILNEITSRAPPGKTLRVVLNAEKLTKTLDVFVEPVEFDSGWLEPTTSLTSGDMGMISARTSGYGYLSSTIQRSSMLDPTNPPNPELELERYEWLKTGKLQPSLNHYKLHLATFLNGRPTLDHPISHRVGDRLDVFYNLEDVTGTTEKSVMRMLKSYKALLSKSMLYEWEALDEEEDEAENEDDEKTKQ